MVLTLVPATRMPWITSGLAKRSVTRWPAGTGMQRGTNANWVATMRVVTAPSGPTVVPRLPSANSPFWPSVCGSSGSTWEGGFSAMARLLATTTIRISPTTPATTAPQRSSVRRMSCSVTAAPLADRATRQEDEEVDEEPAEHHEAERRAGPGNRTPRDDGQHPLPPISSPARSTGAAAERDVAGRPEVA